MYDPKLMMSQKENSTYLLFEDFTLQYADLSVVTEATLTIDSNSLEAPIIVDIANEDGIHVGSPENGYSAIVSNDNLGFSNEEIPDDIYYVTYTYNYTIGGIGMSGSVKRRFALYAIAERKVYKKLLKVHEHYSCDKPWASKYVKDTLLTRALLKSLESSAYLGFEDNYIDTLATINKILEE